MKVLLDENVARKFQDYLAPYGFEIQTAQDAGFRGYDDRRLIDAAEGRFDDTIVEALRVIYPGEVIHVGVGITFDKAARATRRA